MGPPIPRARPKPWANVVFPAPRSPASSTVSPGRAKPAIAAASSRVSSADLVVAEIVTESPSPLTQSEVFFGPHEVGPHAGHRLSGAPEGGTCSHSRCSNDPG